MRARHLILFLVFALFVPALGVGHADPVQDGAGVCDPIDGSACMLPWPNNFFTRPDPSSATGLRLNVNAVATPRNAAGMPVDPTDWNRLDGFSPGSPVLTHVPGMDTPTAFANTNPPTNIDIARSFDEDSPIVVLDAATGRRWPIWTELDRSVDLNGVPPTADRTALIIHPAQNFAEGHRYIVALRDMKNSDGATLAPQSAFADFIDDKGPAARQTYFDEEIFPQLADADIARGSLYLAWDFTVASTQSLTDTILFMRDDALAQLGDTSPGDGIVQGSAPKYVIDSVTQQVPCGVNIGVPPVECSTSGPPPLDSRVYAHIQGRVFVPCYLDVPGCPPGARFTYLTPNDVLPTPVPGNTMAANFQCNIPIGAKDGEQFRPAVYGHGLFGTADEVNSGKLYELGKYGLMLCATDEIGMAQEDIPNGVATLANISNFPSMSARLQQGMINFLYLGRALINPSGFCADTAFQVNGRCVVDTSHLYYDGGSQGAIFGGALTAVDPDFTRAQIAVAGMNYSVLLTRSSDFDTYAMVLYRTYTDPLERQLILSFIQNLWDHGEADGYAEHMTTDPLPGTPAHSVLMTVAFGDHQVTNWASEVEARTIGAHMRAPVLDPDRYPGPHPWWGVPRIGDDEYPYSGSAALVLADVGPLRDCPTDGSAPCSGGKAGTTPPPLDNNANRPGIDPHGPDWAESAGGIAAIGAWLRPDGALPPVCGAHPCYIAGWNGP